MNTVQNLILVLFLLFSTLCQDEMQANEFEENEIISEVQLFSFKTIHPSMIVLIMKNENYNINSHDEKMLTIYNKSSKESKECLLYGISYCILDDSKNKGENEYILKFKNYKGGSFIIYNSLNAYPLKNLENGFNLRYTFDSDKDINLNFYTEVLRENVLLDLYPGESIKIKKVLDTGTEETMQIKDNLIELPKNFKYKIEFIQKDYKFEISIKKRETLNYVINDELKLNLYQTPCFIIIKPSDYNNDIIYSYLYYYDYVSYQIEMAEIDSEIIKNWNEIEYFNETRTNTFGVYEINTINVTKTYLLIKLTLLNRFNNDNIDYFYTFKIFKEFRNHLEPINSQEETLIIEYWNNKMIFISSTTSNLRTFEKQESNSLIYQKQSSYLPFIILPTQEPYQLERFNLDNIYGEIFFNEKSFNNYLSTYFDSVIKQNLWYFDINETFTIYIKSLFGNPIIYYTDIINQEIINDIEDKKFEKVKRYNISNDIITFDAPFAFYVDPYENSYLNFILNNNENLYISKETSNKYLIENKEYVLKAPSKLMVMIDENVDSKVEIIKEGTIIATLTKENPSIKIQEPNKDLIFKSNKNSFINLYHNITDIFLEESTNIITYPIDKKGEIMIVKILSHESKSYFYAINYGYDYLIPPDTKKITTTQTYFYIEDPYTKLATKKDNLRNYLILFDNNIKYEISYIKQYEKEKNSFYYKIQPKDNYAISSEFNFPSGYYTYEILLCSNENVNMTIVDIYNTTQTLTNNEIIISQSDKKALFTFESTSEFIFLQKENKGFTLFDPVIKFYIPKIENRKISILLFNDNFDLNTEYSFLIIEDKNKDDDLMNKIDNECFLFSLINKEVKDVNYEIVVESVYQGQFLYKEIEYTKFANSKYLLVKIYSCKNEKDICVFSKTQRIYLENLENNNDEEIGITKIEEFTEYKVTTQDYIFSYDYKNYLNTLEDIFIYITSPTTDKYYVGELEVINPNLQNFNFKYRYTETIPLIKNQHIISNGRYYFIFRNCSGVSFYLHNTIHFFPLNKINNYISETDHLISNGNGLIYFTLTLEEDKYIYLEWNTGRLYLYSITDKTTERKSVQLFNADKIKKGSYILILDYGKNSNGYHFMINTNRYLIDLEKNKKIKVEMGTQNILQPTVAAVVNLSKYDNELYLVSDSKYANIISCEQSMDIESIIENGRYGSLYLDTHIKRIDEINQEKCDPPYYNIKLYTSRFELVTDIYDITTSQNITLKNNETAAFTVRGNGYKLVLSDQENMKWLDKMQTEFVNTIISSEQIQFKVNPMSNLETNLRIKIIENEYNISIDTLTNNEISTRIRYNDDKIQINYYINLSKNKFLINHFNYLGKLELYISKDEMNENIIEEMLKTNDVDMNLFNPVTQNTFELANNRILAIKKEKNVFSELLMTPLIHDFTIEHTSSKYLTADRNYYIFSNVTILLEENSNSIIKVYDINNTLIGSIENNNPIFENKNYNKTLYLKSDKNTIIYIYYHIKENSRNIINNKKDNVLILFSSDCEYNKLKYCFDNGFENYMPFNLDLKDLEYPQIFINSFDINETTIQKGTYHITYIECENKLLNSHSDFYENSTLNEGSYLIEKNRNIYMNSPFGNKKRNLFYQIFECNQNNYTNNEFYVSIDGLALEKLNNNTSSFMKVYSQIELYLKAKEEFIFNYYKSDSSEDDYNNLEKNSNPHFNISYNSRNEIKIEILPNYKSIDFDFYFFMYLDRENKPTNSPLSNKCRMKKLIPSNNGILNADNIIAKKIEYKKGKIINNVINTPELKTGEIMHSNILGIGKIFPDIEEYIFYDEQSHRIEDSDFSNEENEGLSGWAIFGIVIGLVALILLGVLLLHKIRKKNNGDIEVDNEKQPLALEE